MAIIKKRKPKKIKAGKPDPVPQPQKAVRYFERGHADVLRSLRKAKGFERQRLAKRIGAEKKKKKKKNAGGSEEEEGGDGKLARLEREVEVLKHLDLDLAARMHLAHAMLRTKEITDTPSPLLEHLATSSTVPANKEKQWNTNDVHNITSNLYNQPIAREAISKAIMRMCLLLCVPVPDKHQRHGRTLQERLNTRKPATDIDSGSDSDMMVIDDVEEEEEESEKEEEEEDSAAADDDDEVARELAKFDALDGDASDDNGAPEKSDAFDGFFIDESPDVPPSKKRASQEDSSSDEDSRPRKRRAADRKKDKKEKEAKKAEKEAAAAAAAGFPSELMGGFALADDGDEAGLSDDERAAARLLVTRKNRRGQRARQAIWEKKYKEQSRHLLKQEQEQAEEGGGKKTKISWDPVRGAVEVTDGPRWQQQRRKPGSVHPDRLAQMVKTNKRDSASTTAAGTDKPRRDTKKAVPDGPLHPSWEAAKKAKEKAQTAEFAGKRIVFD